MAGLPRIGVVVLTLAAAGCVFHRQPTVNVHVHVTVGEAHADPADGPAEPPEDPEEDR